MNIITVDVGDTELACQVSGDGPVVILAHGFPDCWDSYSLQVPELLRAGFTTVVPSMRGYAPSGCGERYDPARLGEDLLRLADHFSAGQPARLIGHDWGAVAAYAAAAVAPERWRQMVTMAVPHLRTAAKRWVAPRQLRRSWYMGLFQLCGIAERRVLKNDMALIERLWRDWSPSYRCPHERMVAVKDAIRPNLSAVLGYYRAMAPTRAASRLMFARTQVPAMYLHGEEDGCVGVELAEGMASSFSDRFEQHRIAGAGHFLHIERPERVNRLIVDFFAAAS